MSNRIHRLFRESRSPLLSIYYTAGFPQLNDTVRIATILQGAGADIIELGIPFSDPVADGPTIQKSNKIALDNGMNLALLLEQVKEMRKTVSLPLVLMGYLNPVMQYGIERFAKDAAAAGVDGLILPDLPVAEYESDFKSVFEGAGLLSTFLISPTTAPERIAKIDQLSNSFIYAVAASSTTGAREGFSKEQLEYFARLKNLKLKSPLMIGFGISDANTFRQATDYAAGAIIGSAFIDLLSKSTDLEADISKFVSGLRG
jgi:tryptophan synthase alpha chain